MSTFAEFLTHFPEHKWKHSAQDIENGCRSLIDYTKDLYNKIVSIPHDQVSFNSVVKVLMYEDVKYDRTRAMLNFYQSISDNKAIRDASRDADKKFSDFEIELSMRKDVYDILLSVKSKCEKLDPESQRLLDKLLLYKKRNGLYLEQEIRTEIETINKKISSLCIDFEKNICEENTILSFTRAELDGLTPDFFVGLETDDNGKYKVTLKYPHVIPILKMASNPNTRQQVELAFNSRCIKENVHILEELIQLRHKKASLLGYATHADYVLEILMAKSPKNVLEFQKSLTEKLIGPGKKQLDRLLELKKQDCSALGIPFEPCILPMDMLYYQRMVEERDYKVDQTLVREYFPYEKVTELLLEMYQSMLHLRFEQVKDAETWHPEVTMYAVYDQQVKPHKLMGYFYLDLFPREGKYSHAACFGLQGSCKTDDHNYQLSLAAMVANFTKPLPEAPSLLTHTEVETYFHEFGHVMHHICSRAQYNLFSGTNVERDFVEAPSQMLENWVWEESSLKRLTCHYKTGEPMSDDLISKLSKSRKANSALIYLRQLILGKFDLTIHTSPQADTFAVYKKYQEEYIGVAPTPGTNFAASFCHMCGGYDAQYYGYLWSEVFSCDMFASRFQKEGVFNPDTGLSYRKCILEPGGTKDGMELLKDFLGREPIQEPFLELSGINEFN